MVHLGAPLGEEPLDPPPVRRLALVAEAVVEAAGAVLPELPRGRGQHEAAPGRRPRDSSVAELALGRREALLQLRPRLERLALARRERAELRAARSGREVGVRRLCRHALDAPLYSHLPAERTP